MVQIDTMRVLAALFLLSGERSQLPCARTLFCMDLRDDGGHLITAQTFTLRTCRRDGMCRCQCGCPRPHNSGAQVVPGLGQAAGRSGGRIQEAFAGECRASCVTAVPRIIASACTFALLTPSTACNIVIITWVYQCTYPYLLYN